MPTVLITGGAGLLGRALVRSTPQEWEVRATQRRSPVSGCRAHTVELSDPAAVTALWAAVSPDLVIHTAYSMAAGERDIWAATRNVVDASLQVGAELIYLSSDALLDGENAPYTEDAAPAPVHEYGRWKARAEEYVRAEVPGAAVVRTSLIVSFEPLDPRGEWVVAGLKGAVPVTLFADELRCPIAVADLAAQIWEIARLEPAARGGVWNLAGPEAVSRYTLGLLTAAHLRLSPERLVAGSVQGSPTPRPRDLRLLTSRADRALCTRARPIGMVAASGAGSGTPIA